MIYLKGAFSSFVSFIKLDQRYMESIFIHESFIKVFPTHKMWRKYGVSLAM